MKDVGIIIKGYDNYNKSPIVTKAEGRYYLKVNSQYIRYKEEISNDETVENLIKISMEGIKIEKRGAINTRMHFIKGKNTKVKYSTPLIDINFDLYTENIIYKSDESKIELNIKYKLFSNGEKVSNNKIKIIICFS